MALSLVDYRVVSSTIADAPVLAQKKLMEPFFGFDNGTTDTQIYANAQFATQGLAYWKRKSDGAEFVFLNQQVGGTAWADDEQTKITQFALKSDGTVGSAVAVTGALTSLHSHLSAYEDDAGKLWLYSSAPTVSGGSVTDGSGKGWAKVEWKGASTTNSDVTIYRVFGAGGSSHRYAQYGKGCPQVSSDGKYVVLLPVDYSGNAGGRTHFLYDRAEVEALADPLKAEPVNTPVMLTPLSTDGANALQGEACSGTHTAVLWGGTGAFSRRGVTIVDLQGGPLRQFYIDGSRGQYTTDELFNHPTLGVPASFEPEGVAWRGESLLINFIDFWRTPTSIVTWEGKNWASIAASNTGNYPSDPAWWTETTKTATAGAWNIATTYGVGASTRRSKCIYSVGPVTGDAAEQPLANAFSYQPGIADQKGDDLNIQNAIFPWLGVFRISAFIPALKRYMRAIEFRDGYRLMLFDSRYGADNTQAVEIDNNGGEMRLDAPTSFRQRIGTTTVETKTSTENIDFQQRRPDTDNVYNFGTATRRWLAGYFSSLVVGSASNAGFDASGGLKVQSATAAQIASAANVVNTTDKYAGKIIFDSTNIRLMVAAGSGATSTWRVCDNSATVTPV